jgi:hypothetical protein
VQFGLGARLEYPARPKFEDDDEDEDENEAPGEAGRLTISRVLLRERGRSRGKGEIGTSSSRAEPADETSPPQPLVQECIAQGRPS